MLPDTHRQARHPPSPFTLTITLLPDAHRQARHSPEPQRYSRASGRHRSPFNPNPTLTLRHGTLLTRTEGRIKIGQARFREDYTPVDPYCDGIVSRRCMRGLTCW